MLLLVPNPNIFSCLAESNTVKLETSCKVIDTLTKYVSFLSFRDRFYLKIFLSLINMKKFPLVSMGNCSTILCYIVVSGENIYVGLFMKYFQRSLL